MTFTTFIPTKRNDGSAVRASDRQWIFRETWGRFGGYTFGAIQEGAWRDPNSGKTFFDKTQPLIVHCDRSQLEEARQWVIEIGRRLGQEAMYFEVRDYDGVQILEVT
jgi:hypothetical protein